ncbi:TPA: hypothetical protein ACFNMI_000479 [Neisseria bacilliformis]|uniref:hypothetical protein n=1 Tax=Neisseria bacilliformis TaxID=267212 RepID=UPI000B18EB78|nr:hypothetical protein [Neisseria bacilliformis]
MWKTPKNKALRQTSPNSRNRTDSENRPVSGGARIILQVPVGRTFFRYKAKHKNTEHTVSDGLPFFAVKA